MHSSKNERDFNKQKQTTILTFLLQAQLKGPKRSFVPDWESAQ